MPTSSCIFYKGYSHTGCVLDFFGGLLRWGQEFRNPYEKMDHPLLKFTRKNFECGDFAFVMQGKYITNISELMCSMFIPE